MNSISISTLDPSENIPLEERCVGALEFPRMEDTGQRVHRDAIFSSPAESPDPRPPIPIESHRVVPQGQKRPNPPRATSLLKNTGSVARDHLAMERTWLAYVRAATMIAISGFGLIQIFIVASTEVSLLQSSPLIVDSNELTNPSSLPANLTSNPNLPEFVAELALRERQLMQAEKFIQPLSAVMLFLSTGLLAMGLWRFRQVEKALLVGCFAPNHWGVYFVAAATGLVAGVVVGVFWVTRPR
jgi:uncharacterized membrane protein YidH (DUF202 family)